MGHVGRSLVEILLERGETYRRERGLEVQLMGVVDSGAAVLSSQPLELGAVLELKRDGRGLRAHAAARPGLSLEGAVAEAGAEVLLEATPTNLVDGQPGLGAMEAALDRGMHVVTANKGPLVLAYSRLASRAAEAGVGLAFSACVGGGLPSVNVGRRDLVPARILRLEAVLNSTTHYILTRMEEDGQDLTTALAGAQELGVAEADPRLDLEGWDAASKLVILAQAVLGRPTTLADVRVKGIGDLTQQHLRQARLGGQAIKLLAVAERVDGDWALRVEPTPVDESHPLYRLRGQELGIVYHTDLLGLVTTTIRERGPRGTAAAMLRDLINLFRRGPH